MQLRKHAQIFDSVNLGEFFFLFCRSSVLSAHLFQLTNAFLKQEIPAGANPRRGGDRQKERWSKPRRRRKQTVRSGSSSLHRNNKTADNKLIQCFCPLSLSLCLHLYSPPLSSVLLLSPSLKITPPLDSSTLPSSVCAGKLSADNKAF